MTGAARIVPLTAELTHDLCDQLVAMERGAAQDHGTVYADDVWEADHFLSELPGKWRYSRAALDEAGVLLGFWVASRPGSARVGVYTHRTVVAASARGQGVYRRLLEAVKEAARADGVDRLSLSISTRNAQLVSFYDREGALRLSGEDLSEFAREKGFRAVVHQDRIEESTGHQKFVFVHGSGPAR